MTYAFFERRPDDWHDAGPHGWLYSVGFLALSDDDMPKIAESIEFARQEGPGVGQIVFSGRVMRLFLDFADCRRLKGTEALSVGADVFDHLHARVPLHDVIFHDGVMTTPNWEPVVVAAIAAAEIYAPYGPQRPIDPDAPTWAPNPKLKAILGF